MSTVDIQGKLGEIVSEIKDRKLAIFCGAGISINPPSNLPSATNLRNRILELIICENDTDEVKEIFRVSAYPFEAFIQAIDRNLSIIEIFPALFSIGEPNKNHVFLAELMKSSHISEIMTTNFDEKIEKALGGLGIDYDLFYKEEHYVRNFSEITPPNVFKIHGTIEDISSIRSTVESISSRNPIIARSRILEYFFKHAAHDVLVIGYSGSDEFDINPMLQVMESENTIYYLKHTRQDSEKVGIFGLEYPFDNFKGCTICYDTDKVIDYLWDRFIAEEFATINDNSDDWREIVDNWGKSRDVGWKFFTTAHLMFETQEYEKSIEYFKESKKYFAERADKFGVMISEHNIGRAYQYREDYGKALGRYENSLNVSKRIKDELWVANNLHQIGTVYYLSDELCKAEKYYYRSLAIRERIMDGKGVAASLQQIGRIWQKKRKHYIALAFYEESLEINEQIGNISGISKIYTQIGLIHQDLLNLDESEKFYNLAFEIDRKLGDRMNVCRILNQLGNIYYLKNERVLSKEKYEKSLAIAQKINHEEGIKTAKLNLEKFRTLPTPKAT